MDVVFPNPPDYFTSDQLDRLLQFCYEQGASDITLQTNEPIFAEIQGKQCKLILRNMSNQELSDLINYMYGPNASALISSGTDIDTSYRVRVNKKLSYRFRINITACEVGNYQGMQVTLRTISSRPPALESMNLSRQITDTLNIPQGVLVVSGATGSGKSTLLSSIVGNLVEQPDANLKVVTYESPIEYVYEDIVKPSAIVSQTEIPRYLPSFAAGVRNALRRKPGLILVGEARDKETIEAVIDAALTGHPVYTTVHANGVADTLRRMVTIFPFAERDTRLLDLLESVKVILWQALVPDTNGKRIALREHLVITPAVRDCLISVPVSDIVSETRKMLVEHGCPIWADAKDKYDAGLISQQVYRRFELMQGAQQHG